MIKKKQINKGTVKDQTNKSDIKKKAPSHDLIWECLVCRKRVISAEKPIRCACSNPTYVINTQYKVKE